jgi:tetratricopeptide (TPR) repeat protein
VPSDPREAVERTAAELFIGRVRELVQLDTALAEAVAGRGRLCLIAGEPGIGKTRLAECVAARAGEGGATVIWGRCWEGEGAPAFWPWVQVLRTLLRQTDVATLARWLGAGGPYVAQVVPEVRDVLPDLPVAPPLDSEQARFRLYDAVSALLKNAAASTPLILVLDDLHWADKSSLLLLQFLVREIADSRILLVGTYRDVEVLRGHPLGDVLPQLRRERTVERFLLRGLPDAEVHALLVALNGGEVPEDFTRTLSRETAGNPFFIKEILRHLLDEGLAHHEGDRWVGSVDPSEIRLPESVREVIGRRLARLGDACTKVLTLAAVIGREFGIDVLQRLSTLEEERLLDVLEEAVAAHVVDEVPRSIGRYRFAHTLIRETLYGELRNLERVRLHRRVADVLETLYARNVEPHLAELAHHFLEGLPGGDVDKAIAYAIRAADRDNAQMAYTEAAVQFERALQAFELLDPPDERRRCELLVAMGETRWAAGRPERAGESLEEAAGIAERLGEWELFARAALAVAGPNVGFRYDVATTVGLLDQALPRLEDSDSPLRARVMARLAGLRSFAGDPTGKAALAQAAIAMARRVGDPRALADAISATWWALGGPDDLGDLLARADELIRLATEAGDERIAAEGHLWKAGYFLEMGDIAARDREIEIQNRYARTSRHAYHQLMVELMRGTLAVLAGRFEDAEQASQVICGHGELNTGTLLLSWQGFRNLLLELQGRAAELWPQIERLAVAFPRVPMWRAAGGMYRLSAGDTDGARKDLEFLAANDFRDIPRDLAWSYIMARICDLLIAFADAPRAAVAYDLLRPHGDRCAAVGISACRGSLSRPLGLLATLLGRYDDAERHFERALEMNAHIRARVWVAHTQHDYARMLVARDRSGDRERAATLAAEALTTARAVGMKPLGAKVIELRAAAGLGDEIDVVPEPPSAAVAIFQREGDYWTIAYEGKRIRLRDAKGLQYIAQLLRHDGREIYAGDLAAGGDPSSDAPHADGSIAAGLGDAGEALDASARAAYRQRLRDLEAELVEVDLPRPGRHLS